MENIRKVILDLKGKFLLIIFLNFRSRIVYYIFIYRKKKEKRREKYECFILNI